MQSVASHRASVPAVISKALEQQLQAMRPPGAADDAAGPTGVLQAQRLVLQLHSACCCTRHDSIKHSLALPVTPKALDQVHALKR
jgi:hypothetical protein